LASRWFCLGLARLGPGDLRVPGDDGAAQGSALRHIEATVGATRIGLLAGEHAPEPVPLHLRQMLDEAGQREARRWHGCGGGLLIVQALALDGEGGAVTERPGRPIVSWPA
jgi:hypothetical protein